MCVPPLPTFHMSQYHCGPSDHISRWHLIKYSPIVLKTLTFCIHVHHATPHKDIRLATTLDDLLTNTPAFFKGNYTGSYIQHPRKVTEFGCTPSCCICWIVPVPSAFAFISHVPISWQFKSPHVSRWHLVEHSPRIISVPTFCIHANQATPYKDIRLAITLNEMFMNKPAIFMCS